MNAMKYRYVLSVLTWIVIFTICFPVSLNADFVITKTKRTIETSSNGSDQKTNSENGTTWISKNKMRQDDGATTSVIIRLDKNKVFILNHLEKTYSELALPIKLEENLTPEAEQIIRMMKIASTVAETHETRVIKGWKCQKFLADMSISMMGMDMPMRMEIWTSKETGINLKSFREFYEVLLAINPFTKDLVKEFRKIVGYPVLTEISMLVKGIETKSQEEVLTVEESKAPRDTYELPAEYTLVTYNPLILGNGNSKR